MYEQNQQQSGSDLLMSSGGDGTKSWTWSIQDALGQYQPKPYGTVLTGTIAKAPEVAQQRDYKTGELETWSNGDPKLKVIITLQTTLKENADDDGIRALHVKKGLGEHNAIRDAVLAAGASAVQVGGVLTMTLTGQIPNPSGQGYPVKTFSATYAPPAQNLLMGQPEAGTAVQQPLNSPLAQQVFGAQMAAGHPVTTPPPVAQPQLVQPVQQHAAPNVDQIIGVMTQAGKTPEEIAPMVGLTPEQVRDLIPPF
jgi:hypothetical protein